MTQDASLVTLGPFPAGLNNKAQPENGPADALQQAVNVDLDAQGYPQRRRGQDLHVEGTAHSLFGLAEHLLAYVDGELRAYRVEESGPITLEATLLTGLADRFISFASDDFDVYFSNGVVQGRIDESFGLHPFWIGTPDPVTLAVSAAGGMAAGQYEVSATVTDADGRESGASPPVMVTLAAGQGIGVIFPAPPDGTARWRVYVSPPNDDNGIQYRCAELPANATGYAIGAHVAGGVLETAWMTVMPPATTLRIGHNRMVTLQGNVLRYSPPYRFGLVEHTANLILGHVGTLLEPVGEGGDVAGWWAADHKRTYWLGGADPGAWRQIVRYPHPAVPGSSLVAGGADFALDTAEPVAYWMASNGVPCIGLPGGQLQPLREASLALPVDAERGASALLLFDGIRQVLTTTFGGAVNRAAVSDSADAIVRRRTA